MGSEVQVLPGPPFSTNGGIAQLGERLLCKQQVVGSIPSASTTLNLLMKVKMILFFEIVNINIKYIENFNFEFFYICV